jgi:tetratricopeptide (TPR) repeat protein
MELATRGGLERQALLAAQRLGGALSRLGRHEEALLCMRPLSNGLQVLTRDERLNWRSDFGSALDYADHRREALQVLDAVVEEATPHGRLSVAAAALSLSSNVLGYLGRTHDGLRAAEQALVLYRRAGLEEAHLLVDESNQLGMLRDLGHFEAYLARAEHLPAAMRAAGSAFWAANTEHDLATAYAWLGRADLALRTLSAQPLDELPPMMRAARLVTRSRLTRDFGVGGGAPGTSPQAMLQQAQALLASVQAAGRSHFSLAVALQVARDAEPDSALATAAHLEAEGLRRENLILACSASGVRLRLLLDTGDADGAAAVASRLLQHIDAVGSPPGNYAPELWWLAYQGLRSREPAAAQAALIQAVQWVRQRARDHVPEHHRESFLNRNPVNRAVLAAAQGLGL